MKLQLPILALSAWLGVVAQVTPSQAQWQPAPVSLKTPWAARVSPQNALPDYPRPQMVRKNWQSLNGLWSYGVNHYGSLFAPGDMNRQILVPFPYESSLSGIGQPSPTQQKLWYKRTFTVPKGWKNQNVLLHFGAVNYEATVVLNGHVLGTHRGGFDGFNFDITSELIEGENKLVLSVMNPLKTDIDDAQVVGKQRVTPGGIFYTGATGIWQSVWLEPVPVAHIADLHITPNIDKGVLGVGVELGGQQLGFVPDRANAPRPDPKTNVTAIRVEAFDSGKRVARIDTPIATVGATAGRPQSPFYDVLVPLPNPKLWSPDSPFLYDLKVTLLNGKKEGDSVSSYAGMRKISLGKDEQGRTRIFLNNKFVFQVGALDQGYWPDGIYTAPTDDALKFDVQAAKNLGWNMLRKHAKVEPDRWYYWTDKLGVLVWQDMPQMYGGRDGALSDAAKAQFDTEWHRIIAQHYNSPSIVVWTTFNEGWGQHDTERVVAYTKELDPSRLVNNASGWTDKNVGDLHDTHAYPGPGSNAPEATRAAVNGEFGGITMSVPGHRWQNNAGVMGYGATLQSGWLVTKRYQNLLKAAYDLKDTRGTSAFVYTQLTDVEQEINGLLTYDRAVMKPDAKIIAAANRGQFLPLPPNPNPELVATSDDEPSNWKYTTDKPADDWFSPSFNDADWKIGAAPFGHDAGGVRTQWTTNDIWIRRTFQLPAQIPAKLNLLVKHDEDAEIYVNGVLAGTATGYTGDYTPIPMSDAARATLKPGENTFAVHVHQTVGGQSIDVGIAAAGQ